MPDPEDKSFIEKIPEPVRKKIFVISLVIITTFIFIGWVINFKISLQPSPEDEARRQEWQQIQEDFTKFLDQSQQDFSQVKENITQINQEETQPSENMDLKPEDILELKNKLIAKEVEKWGTYINQYRTYLIKYPTTTVEFIIDESAQNTSTFKFIDGGRFAIEGYNNEQNLPALDWFSTQHGQTLLSAFSQTKVNNLDAYQASINDSCRNQWVLVVAPKKIYAINGQFCQPQPEQSLNTFQTIISTFQLIP